MSGKKNLVSANSAQPNLTLSKKILIIIMTFLGGWVVYIAQLILMVRERSLALCFIGIPIGLTFAAFTQKPNFLLFYGSTSLVGFFIALGISFQKPKSAQENIKSLYIFLCYLGSLYLGFCMGHFLMYLLEFTYLVWVLLTYK